MSGIMYYYWKSSWKTFLPAFCLATVYPLGMVLLLVFSKDLDNANINILSIVPALAYILFCVNAVTGSLEVKEKKNLKILLSAPITQKKALLGKYVFVGIATIAFTLISILFCVIMHVFCDINMADAMKMTFTILGLRLILSTLEVPLYHIFNKQITSNILMGAFMVVIFGVFIACMFVNMDTIIEIGKKLLDISKNKYMPIVLNAVGVALTFASYFCFSKVKQEIE